LETFDDSALCPLKRYGSLVEYRVPIDRVNHIGNRCGNYLVAKRRFRRTRAASRVDVIGVSALQGILVSREGLGWSEELVGAVLSQEVALDAFGSSRLREVRSFRNSDVSQLPFVAH
jgi:hypothetical protein